MFLVDNASSMARFWKHATYLLRVLVWRALECDDDGMELVFTMGQESLGLKPQKTRKQKKRSQEPGDFTKKMDDARPDREANVKTDMKASLESILGSHLRAHRDGDVMKRGLTLLVLTDGLWAANDERDVEEYLVTFIKTNKADWGWKGDGPDKGS